MNTRSSDYLFLAGWAGVLASILVGIGEFSMQFTPNGGIENETTYAYFNEVSNKRLSFGHFIAVLSAPLYVLGYWFLYKKLAPAGSKLALLYFLIAAYSFIIGTAWISERFFLAETVHAIAAGDQLQALLATFSKHNEPFVNILRVGMLLVSIIWIKQILTGKTDFPKWMAIFSPIPILVILLLLYNFKDNHWLIFISDGNECDSFHHFYFGTLDNA